jgi:hypothetical protein
MSQSRRRGLPAIALAVRKLPSHVGMPLTKKKAISDYSDAIRLDQTYTLAYINRGVSYFHTEEYEKASATTPRRFV